MAVIMCVLICTIRITFCATSSLSPTVRVKCFEGAFILSAAVSSSITAPQYYRGRFNPKKLYRGCGVRLRCLLQCAGVVCSVQVRCAACRCGVQLIVVRDFLCLWHSSEDNLGDKTSRTSPGGGTTLQE